MLANCKFQNIVSLHGICDEPSHKGLVMEYLPKGSLRDVLNDTTELLDWSKRWTIAIETGKGLQYLHDHKIIHRDLKSPNILLNENYHVKICDFGLAKIRLETTAITTNRRGTTRWRAPETFKKGHKPDTAMDIYSYGMILWELASRQLPYSSEADEYTVMSMIKDGEKETIPADCPKTYAEIINDSWLEAANRPAIDKIVSGLSNAKPVPVSTKNTSTTDMQNTITSKTEPKSSLQIKKNHSKTDRGIA